MTLDIHKAASWAVTAARDWSLGYGQGSGTGGRLDIRDGGAADCSSFVTKAYNVGGLTPALPDDTYTGNLRTRLQTRGFQVLPASTTPQLGDVLLWEGHHVAMCVGPDTLAEAWINELGTITGGTPGDQTGQETRLIAASQHPDRAKWDYLLRPPTAPTSAPAEATTTSREDTGMQIVTSTATKTQWLVTSDGTMVELPNTEYARVAQKMVTGQLQGINAREVDVLKDIARRVKEARK